jgi:DNA-nicking Smr family endonuclease
MTSDDAHRHRRRKLNAAEHALWSQVIRSVVPLRARAVQAEPDMVERPGKTTLHPEPIRMRAAAASVGSGRPSPVRTPEPALAPLERRLRQRLARGAVAIDACLDLHGRTQADARALLQRFLHNAQGDGAKVVLVITGKGARDHASERGVLKRQVPVWLGLPEFRGYVIGFEDAHIGHGGEGALYVRVRRPR